MLAGKHNAGSSMHLNDDETGKMVSFVYKFVSRERQYRGCGKCHAHKKRSAMTKLESGRKSKIIMLVSSDHSLKVLNQYFFNLFYKVKFKFCSSRTLTGIPSCMSVKVKTFVLTFVI